MQKSIREIEAEFDLLIEEFDRATRGLWHHPVRDAEPIPAYRVAKIYKFPQREALQ